MHKRGIETFLQLYHERFALSIAVCRRLREVISDIKVRYEMAGYSPQVATPYYLSGIPDDRNFSSNFFVRASSHGAVFVRNVPEPAGLVASQAPDEAITMSSNSFSDCRR